MTSWQIVLIEPAKTMLTQIGQFITNTLLVLVILIIGWILAKLVKTIVAKVLNIVKLDELASRIELDTIIEKGGLKYSLSELIGVICYWLALLITFAVAVNSIGLTIVTELLNRVVLYVPNIIAAIFIMIIGMFCATLLGNIVEASASNAGLGQGRLLSRIAKTVVVIFAIAIALDQLNIGAATVQLIMGVLLASVGVGLALAFGLGCKDLAAKFMEDLVDKLKKK